MNKKAYLTNFVFGFIGLFVLLVVLVSLMSLKYNPNFDLNETTSMMNDLQTNFSIRFSFDNIPQGNTDLVNVILKVTYSFINFILQSTFEIVKLAIKVGYENPDLVNPQVLLWLIVFSLAAPILFVLFKIIIIIILLTKEHFQSRKEKKELKKYE